MKILSLILAIAASSLAWSQIPGLKTPKIDLGLDSVFKKGPAITTSLKDAKWAAPDRDGFAPDCGDLFSLDRGPKKGFILREGAFAGTVQSYCLKAGTHGPGGGEAYLYAPPLGPYEKAVMAIAENSVDKPDIPQRKIQLLLWAIIARTKFSDLSRDLQATAAQLLSSKQITDLNGGALQFITDEAFSRGLLKEPPLVRQVLEAENKLRQTFANPAAGFEEFEAIAVLTGQIGLGEGSIDSPSGRWSNHPDGFMVRYIPSGYSMTRVEVFVPAGSKAIGKEFNPATHIAVPTNTNRQRLLQSARPYRD